MYTIKFDNGRSLTGFHHVKDAVTHLRALGRWILYCDRVLCFFKREDHKAGVLPFAEVVRED